MANEPKLMPCRKCGAGALPFREVKANESDYRLVGIKCIGCGSNQVESILKSASGNETDAAVMRQLKVWNERSLADGAK